MNALGRALAPRTLRSAIAVVVLAVVAAAHAQTPPPVSPPPTPAADQGLEAIVVTAQKRSEQILRVPVAITSSSRTQLADLKIDNASILAEQVPGLHVNGINGSQTPVFALRGISMFDYSFNQSSPVALYRDEVYKGTFALFGVEMYDLARVEVLRGPQGTLYGRNTTGGAINIFSEQPGTKLNGYLRAGAGNYDRREVEGAIGVPIIAGKLAVRAAFTYVAADGWAKNIAPGQPNLEGIDQFGGRLSILYTPRSDLSLLVILSASRQHPEDYLVYGRPGPLGVGAGIYDAFHAADPLHNPSGDYFRGNLSARAIDAPLTQKRDQNTQAASLKGDWQISPELTLTSITSYDYGDIFVPDLTDSSPIQVLRLNYYGRTHQYTQDVRLTSNHLGPIELIVGGYYDHELVVSATEQQYFNGIDVNGDGLHNAQDCIDGGLFIACRYANHFRQIRDSVAGYADASYTVRRRVKLRLGVRYTDDTGRLRDFNAQVRGPDEVPIANTIPGDPNNLNTTLAKNLHNDALTGHAGLDLSLTPDLLLYGSYSRGYRSGAFNAQAFFTQQETTIVKPETIDSFEIGVKLQAFARRLQVSADVFAYDYRNQQILNIDPVTAAQQLINLPRSRIRGLEIEATARPVPSVTLRGTFALLDARFREARISGTDIAGNYLPNAPEEAAMASIDWTFLKGERADAHLYLDGNYQSRQYFEVSNVARLGQAPYLLLNGRLAVTLKPRNLTLALWGRNLTNKFYITSAIDILQGFGVDYFHVGAPRTFGGDATIKF